MAVFAILDRVLQRIGEAIERPEEAVRLLAESDDPKLASKFVDMFLNDADLAPRMEATTLLESVKKVGLYPTTVSPGLIETRWEETTHTGEPLHEQQTKLVRRYLLRIEKRAFDNRVTIEAQAKRCIPATLRFGESEVDGKCAPVPTLPPPLLTELHRTAERLEQLFTIP